MQNLEKKQETLESQINEFLAHSTKLVPFMRSEARNLAKSLQVDFSNVNTRIHTKKTDMVNPVRKTISKLFT